MLVKYLDTLTQPRYGLGELYTPLAPFSEEL